jgi:hypothetical protein
LGFGFAPSVVKTSGMCPGHSSAPPPCRADGFARLLASRARRLGADAQPHHCLHRGRIWLLGWPNTSRPLPRRSVIDHARALCQDDTAVIGIVDLARAEVDLAAGELACPGCGGELRRWGHERARKVCDWGSATLTLRPRRARCGSYGGTYVLLAHRGAAAPSRHHRGDRHSAAGQRPWDRIPADRHPARAPGLHRAVLATLAAQPTRWVRR